MKDLIDQLKDLKTKISATWEMLSIDSQILELKKLEDLMQKKGFWGDQEKAKEISKKHEELKTEIDSWTQMRDEVEELVGLGMELEKNPDTEMQAEAEKRIKELQKQFEKLEFLVLLDEKHDKNNAIVSFHAGSGGTEAQDWAEMLRRMILRFCEDKDWKTTVLDESIGSEAGIKSSTIRVEGRYAFGHLKSEHGTHRLVRISPFDAESMRHTSFALIEVIPEIEADDELDLDPKDLRIDTFMAGGHGGQSVNTTYSAVRIVHEPTGTTVQCQNERSQLQNKETAMKILRSKLQQQKEEQEEKERQELKGEHKSPEWGSQIRSYVLHPYKMVKDLRTKHETKEPDKVLDGELDSFIQEYLKWKKSQ